MLTVSDYLFQKASQRKIPLMGSFELSPVCNFACKMCYVRKTPEQICKEGKKLIPWQDWLRLAEQCRDAGMLYLLLTGGEPFIYPGFRELYTRLHNMGFVLYINSNGTMIDEETVAWLKANAPSRINITLYGTSPETYKRICGHADGYNRAVRAITMLQEAGIPVVINASMIPENAADLEAINAFGKRRGINTRIATYMFPPMRRDKEDQDSRFSELEAAEMFIRLIRCQNSPDAYHNILLRFTKQNSQNGDSSDDWGCHQDEFMRCRAGRSTFWVNWEGNMTACGMMDFPMRVRPFDEPFLECWNKLTNCVRSTPVLKGCAGCDRREICNPCVAMIYGETGTVDQKAPYMCQLSENILKQMKQELEEIQHE